MSNVLKNPTLSGFTLGRYFTDQEGKVGTIENPNDWEFVTIARESDPEKLPQSLHRDRGFVIAAGYRSWEAAYVQKGVQLEANQRYMARALFKPDVNFPPGQNTDLTAVTWRFRMVAGNQVLEQDWAMTQKGQLKQDEDFQFVFEAKQAMSIEYQFWARSVYAGNSADFKIYQLTLEPVAADYGATIVPSLGTGTVDDADTIEAPKVTTSETNNVSAAEIDEIIASLRSLAEANAQAIEKLNALVERLKKLK